MFLSRVLLLAIGLWKPNIPADIQGIEHAVGYEDMTIDPDFYSGKNVLILGNLSFDVIPIVSFLNVHVRTRTYKSARVQSCAHAKENTHVGSKMDFTYSSDKIVNFLLSKGHGNSAFETAQSLYDHANMVHMLGRSRVRLAWQTHYVGDVRGVNNELLDSYQLKSLDGVVEGPLSDIKIEQDAGRLRVTRKRGASADNFALRQPYDVIIRCLGWKFDRSLFNR